ncbi:hypothetical protein GF356_12595 [candidate division GN15 bacterium]|nr:hypothetical protein [candidate division GN15 bacterium]
MARRRIIYHDWLARERAVDQSGEVSNGADSEIDQHVQRALATLSENEREFIVHFYFMGQTEQQIAKATGRTVIRVHALHRRAVRKLRRSLGGFVAERFGLELGGRASGCPVCESEFAAEIDWIIANRDRKATWRPVMREIHESFGIQIRSPQVLIGHERYHSRSQRRQDNGQ